MTLRSAIKPEYVFNPAQAVRRLLPGPRRGPDRIRVALPWGGRIEVRRDEEIGRAIRILGVYDLALSEVLWRLADPGEVALDVGANIGYMTSLLAARLGPRGSVLSFEAHPDVAADLRANVAGWAGSGGAAIRVVELAASDRDGLVRFEEPPAFAGNRGLGRVCGTAEGGGRTMEVRRGRLDDVAGDLGPIGVAKMDVEGHEEAVLRGAAGLLGGRRVRDWAFEHHPNDTRAAIDAFERNGYRVFRIEKRFFGPALVPAASPGPPPTWEPPNFLATADPARSLARIGPRGWRVLRGG